jgi:hypothetical protein
MNSARISNYHTLAWLGLFLCLLSGCSANNDSSGKMTERIGTRESPVTSEQLVGVFQQGPDAVKKLYLGRSLIVRGKIQGIDGAPGQVILAAETGDPNAVPWISCKPKDEHVGKFQLLKLGDVITATGLAYHVGKNDLFLRDCALVAAPDK